MKKRYKIIISLIAALLLTAVIGWTVFKNTPKHSLLKAVWAFENGDADDFSHYADIDSVIYNTFDPLLAEPWGMDPVSEETQKSSIIGMKDIAQSILHSALIDLVKTGSTDALRSIPMPFIKDILDLLKQDNIDLGSVVGVEKSDTDTRITVTVSLLNPALEFPVEFRLRPYEGHWKVVDIENVGEVFTSLRKAVQKKK